MNIVVLGGNSQRHQQWIRDLGGALEPIANKVIIHDYKSWEDGTDTDVEYEMSAIAPKIAELDDVVIVAKSIGTIVTTLGIASGAFNSTRCILLGLPLSMVHKYFPDLGESFAQLPNVTLVQNETDPYGSVADVEAFVKANAPKNCTLISIPSNETHDYLDFDQIKSLLVR